MRRAQRPQGSLFSDPRTLRLSTFEPHWPRTPRSPQTPGGPTGGSCAAGQCPLVPSAAAAPTWLPRCSHYSTTESQNERYILKAAKKRKHYKQGNNEKINGLFLIRSHEGQDRVEPPQSVKRKDIYLGFYILLKIFFKNEGKNKEIFR